MAYIYSTGMKVRINKNIYFLRSDDEGLHGAGTLLKLVKRVILLLFFSSDCGDKAIYEDYMEEVLLLLVVVFVSVSAVKHSSSCDVLE